MTSMKEKLLNSSVEIEGVKFDLKNGAGSSDDYSVLMEEDSIYIGEINQGDVEGSISLVAFNSGGSGTFYYLVVHRFESGEFRQLLSTSVETNYEEREFRVLDDKSILVEIRYREGYQTRFIIKISNF
ncbi:hypothetical protein [Grimontia marina]|uniref:Uncharacterized protein n=1 Tax=Grimontia marina TaxID=646534 RepID=A0A128F7C5_9GAMM|nr:hypothetical protein [Grimontia marina]CZF82638.1 hypothetical protein GMA8713_02300 [Grimontia marina]